MNLFDVFRVLARRWYLTLPGVLLAFALAGAAWFALPPGYSRSASLLLLPSQQSLPDAGNPYLYMSGLSQAADVLVRSVNSQQNLNELSQEFPGSTVTVTRDPSTVTPVIVISVQTKDDAGTGALLRSVVQRAGTALSGLQSEEKVTASSRISIETLTSDTASTVSDKSRMLTAGAAGIGGVAVVVLAVATTDGLLAARGRRRERAAAHGAAAGPAPLPAPLSVPRDPARSRARAGGGAVA